METPSVFAAAQQGLHALKLEAKSAMRQTYHRHYDLANFLLRRTRAAARGYFRRVVGGAWRSPPPPRSVTVGPRCTAPQSMHVPELLNLWLFRATQSNQRTIAAS
jgi:hypothetical protein